MRAHFAAFILGLSVWTTATAAQNGPVATADAFLRAILTGNVVAIRNLRTEDALIGAGHVAGPMAEADEILGRFSQLKCSVGPLAISPKPVAPNTLGLASLNDSSARWVQGTISCPTATGGVKETPIQVAVARGKVAVFAF